MESDAELVQRARHGDSQAFGALCCRYERSAVAFAISRGSDLQSAEDAVQEAMILAYHRISQLEDDGRFSAWLFSIVFRQVADQKRGRQDGHYQIGNCDEHLRIVSERAGPNADWIDREQLLCLIAKLPELDQQLIGLRYFDGFSMAEIAQITGRPLGTITKQISRTVIKLRELYQESES